ARFAGSGLYRHAYPGFADSPGATVLSPAARAQAFIDTPTPGSRTHRGLRFCRPLRGLTLGAFPKVAAEANPQLRYAIPFGVAISTQHSALILKLVLRLVGKRGSACTHNIDEPAKLLLQIQADFRALIVQVVKLRPVVLQIK